MTKKISNHSQFWYICQFLTSVGLLVSFYSAFSHYKNYSDPQYSSFCALTQSINCDTVAQSPWSIFLGLPIAWWGILFFLSFLTVLARGRSALQHSWNIVFYIALMSSVIAIILGILSIFKIHSLCLLCLTAYAITFLLTFFCWKAACLQIESIRISHQQINKKSLYRSYAISLAIFLTGIIILYLFLPRYWIESFSSSIKDIPQGLTQEGHPWIGAENPELTIIQFSDYQCFQCAKMHFFLRRLVEGSPGTIRLVHRNYPLDHTVNPLVVPEPFHIGSAKLAKLAILASLRNKFWNMNDLLYSFTRNKNEEIPLQEISDSTGLETRELTVALNDPTIQELLNRDIWRGMKLGITGTPTFVIGENVYQGHIPESVLDKIFVLSKGQK